MSRVQVNTGTLYPRRGTFPAGRQPAPLPDHVLNMLTSLRVELGRIGGHEYGAERTSQKQANVANGPERTP